MRILKGLLREPILHFLLLGMLFYGAVSFHARLTDPHRIVVTDSTIAQIRQKYMAQFGEAPSPDQFAALIDRHIHEEALYRQGVALGLVENDELVRRRIVQKMEFLDEGEAEIGEPSAAQLKAFYLANAARYLQPARVSFSHVYFSPDTGGDTAAQARAGQTLASLRAKPDQPVAALGDSFPERPSFSLITGDEIEHVFGHGGLETRVFDLPLGVWSGPLRSGYGWHLVKVEAREPPQPPNLAEIDQDLRADWREAEQAKHRQQALDALMRDYVVIRQDRTSLASAR